MFLMLLLQSKLKKNTYSMHKSKTTIFIKIYVISIVEGLDCTIPTVLSLVKS